MALFCVFSKKLPILFTNPHEFAIDFDEKSQKKVLLLIFYCKKTLNLCDFLLKSDHFSTFSQLWISYFPSCFCKKAHFLLFFHKNSVFFTVFLWKSSIFLKKGETNWEYAVSFSIKLLLFRVFFQKNAIFIDFFAIFYCFFDVFIALFSIFLVKTGFSTIPPKIARFTIVAGVLLRESPPGGKSPFFDRYLRFYGYYPISRTTRFCGKKRVLFGQFSLV